MPTPQDAPSNLFEPVAGAYGAHGRFDGLAKLASWKMFTSRHRGAVWATVFVGVLAGAHLLAQRLKT